MTSLTCLNALFLGDVSCSLLPTVAEDPIYNPPVQTNVNPSRVFRVFGALNILNDSEMLASLAHDLQRG
jgi:hypothetical protein